MKKWLLLGLCGVIIAYIWHNSLQSAWLSDSRSLAVLALVEKGAAYLGLSHTAVLTNHVIRKAAHVSEYFVLGNAVRLAVQYLPQVRRRAWCYTIVFGIGIASIDESLQLFSPGRGAQIQDVGIDTCGVILGCLVMSGLIWLVRKKESA